MTMTIKRKGLAVGIAILLISAGGFLAQDRYHSQKVDAMLNPCTEAMRLNPESGGLPCYQAALQADPNNQELQVRVASNLVYLGRFDEAQSLYKRAASEYGLETSEARKMLQPGAMQQQEATGNQLMQANAEYNLLVKKHGEEAIAFRSTYPTYREPYRTQMQELVKSHVREEREMMVAKGVWRPSVLQEPYFSVAKR